MGTAAHPRNAPRCCACLERREAGSRAPHLAVAVDVEAEIAVLEQAAAARVQALHDLDLLQHGERAEREEGQVGIPDEVLRRDAPAATRCISPSIWCAMC
jgi:hypothetical protein